MPLAAATAIAVAAAGVAAVADFSVWAGRAGLGQKLGPVEPAIGVTVERCEPFFEPGLELFTRHTDVVIKRYAYGRRIGVTEQSNISKAKRTPLRSLSVRAHLALIP